MNVKIKCDLNLKQKQKQKQKKTKNAPLWSFQVNFLTYVMV